MKSRLGISKRTKQTIRDNVSAELDKQVQGIIRRVFKAMCASLNEEYGFGKIRCSRLIKSISAIMDEHATDEIFWYHLDSIVIDRMGMEFDREDYEVLDR